MQGTSVSPSQSPTARQNWSWRRISQFVPEEWTHSDSTCNNLPKRIETPKKLWKRKSRGLWTNFVELCTSFIQQTSVYVHNQSHVILAVCQRANPMSQHLPGYLLQVISNQLQNQWLKGRFHTELTMTTLILSRHQFLHALFLSNHHGALHS